MTALYTLAVFVVLLFLVGSTIGFWVGVYDRGKTRVSR